MSVQFGLDTQGLFQSMAGSRVAEAEANHMILADNSVFVKMCRLLDILPKKW
jgi:hypothetical protein